ncbi:MAG TPA: spore coat protein U domain-containing protein, partial [Ramlibacter sp.]|nr:spore coat protein U domain-containing protein [Ramlibacter sp.]
TANVASQCVVGNTIAMAFGDLTMLDASTGTRSTAKNNATASFNATCTNGTLLPTLKFASANGGGSAFKMLGGTGSDLITYTLYEGATDSGTSIAHNTLAAFGGFVADGAVKSLSVTGKVLDTDKNGKPIGGYADVVTITVGFTAD